MLAGVQAGTRYLVYSRLLQTMFGFGVRVLGGLVFVCQTAKSLLSIVAAETQRWYKLNWINFRNPKKELQTKDISERCRSRAPVTQPPVHPSSIFLAAGCGLVGLAST